MEIEMENIELALNTIFESEPTKLILSNFKDKSGQFKKIVITQKNSQFQVEKFTEKQAFHVVVERTELQSVVHEFFTDGFRQLNAFSESTVFELKISKKGKVFLGKSKKQDAPKQVDNGHNRKKNYLLPEGSVIAPLVDMGIFTKEGKVVQSMYDKFKQINRFIEQVDDAIRVSNLKEMTVIDFGCGKSYLTFILYYYLTEVCGIKTQMIGLDLKEDVITKCNTAAEKYGYKGLRFQMGDINGFEWSHPVDMVITLHACDTATDYALFNAVQWDAKMIFSVPCCQHELNGQIASDELSILTRYGIIKERAAALMTDAVRGTLLEVCGYKTQLLEFVDLSHTPKNILIRAVKSNVNTKVKKERLDEVIRLCDQFGLKPTLLNLLDESGKLSI
jgi:SAM-dependent methyltransferase